MKIEQVIEGTDQAGMPGLFHLLTYFRRNSDKMQPSPVFEPVQDTVKADWVYFRKRFHSGQKRSAAGSSSFFAFPLYS